MSEIQTKLNEYYKEASIASVKEETDSENYYDYEKMFGSFGCPKKDGCRGVCFEKFKPSKKDPKFLFSPRTECIKVSQHYAERQYGNLPIPRIVVVSLSVPKPDDRTPDENSAPRWNPHWRGTTTTVRSLLCPFVCLDPAGKLEDESTKTIEQLFVHIRTGKCFSNAGGTRQEDDLLYENCGCYLKKEVSILKPDVIVTQGNTAHEKSKKYVFDEGAEKTVKGIADSNSIARIVYLKEDNRRVYWLRSYFPYWRFYSRNHAGPKVDCESHIPGAKRKNLVLYGEDIKQFMRES